MCRSQPAFRYVVSVTSTENCHLTARVCIFKSCCICINLFFTVFINLFVFFVVVCTVTIDNYW
jgi:hypothetical protein